MICPQNPGSSAGICLHARNAAKTKQGSPQTHLAKPAAKRAPSSGDKRKKPIQCCRLLLSAPRTPNEGPFSSGRLTKKPPPKTNGRPPIPQAPRPPSRDDRARERQREGDLGRRMPRHRCEAARARREGGGDQCINQIVAAHRAAVYNVASLADGAARLAKLRGEESDIRRWCWCAVRRGSTRRGERTPDKTHTHRRR